MGVDVSLRWTFGGVDEPVAAASPEIKRVSLRSQARTEVRKSASTSSEIMLDDLTP